MVLFFRLWPFTVLFRQCPLADVLEWIKTTSRVGMLTVLRDGREWELGVEGA